MYNADVTHLPVRAFLPTLAAHGKVWALPPPHTPPNVSKQSAVGRRNPRKPSISLLLYQCFLLDILLGGGGEGRRGRGHFSPESIGVIPNSLHGINGGNSRSSACSMYYIAYDRLYFFLCVACMRDECSFTQCANTAFYATVAGLISLRSLCPHEQVDQNNAYTSPSRLIKNMVLLNTS